MMKADDLFRGEPWSISQSTTKGGSRFSFVSAGDGFPVVFLHGFPERWFSWRHQFRALIEAGYRVVAPDLPGLGMSSIPGGRYDLASVRRALLGLFEFLEIERCFLVGHDWGAVVGFDLAAQYPWLVDKLVLSNGPPITAYESVVKAHPLQILRSWYILCMQMPGAANALASKSGKRFMRWVLERTLTRPSDSVIDACIRDLDTGRAEAAVSYYREAFRLLVSPFRASERKKLRRAHVHCETLVVWGEDDWCLDAKMIEHMTKMQRSWLTVRPIPGAGHFVHHDAPEEFNRALLDFFSSAARKKQLPLWR